MQIDEFKNLKDLLTRLGDETEARKYMEKMRWNGEPFCPHCNATRPYVLKGGRRYRCRVKSCRKDFTVLVGTIFENTKLPLSYWIAAFYLLTSRKKGISSPQLARDLGIKQSTAWFMLQRIRLTMVDRSEAPLEDLVEVDEKYVGGHKDKMNAASRKRLEKKGGDNKTPVMGLLQRDGRLKLTVIGKLTFKEIVRHKVSKTATVFTDAHPGYTGLQNEFADHQTVAHSIGEWRKGIAHINGIENFFSLFERTIFGTYHHISPKHLHRYCAESSYRFNTRKQTDAERFRMTISNVEGRLKYKDLIQKNQNETDTKPPNLY